jgi:hypothetical protein
VNNTLQDVNEMCNIGQAALSITQESASNKRRRVTQLSWQTAVKVQRQAAQKRQAENEQDNNSSEQ